jgi:uncharacterized protein (DUF433 family)
MTEMTEEVQITITPRAQAALDELQALIAAHFPQATFTVEKGYEPAGIYLVTTVDTDDTDEVVEVFIDRLVDIQVEDGIPVYVTVRQPRERVMAELREQQSRALPAPLPDRIVQDPAVSLGQPVVSGTQMPVEIVLAYLAHNPDFDELLADYPQLSLDDVRACLAYAQSLVATATRLEAVNAPAAR